MKELNSESFRQELEGEQVVLIDFWADWCTPCKMFAPIFEELAEELDGQASLAKVNVDKNGALAEQYSVSSVPTLVLFKNGKEIERMVGVRSKEALAEMVTRHQ